ncbi:MAG: hypothetical protein BWY06_03463 [Candidatus Latescibacteria bacterium ADurb.Bin168]|nr:MAG: hypothetical protein BWY06_03463 [Candidatus Latescibacteria bacterium ADurb.Bin168]
MGVEHLKYLLLFLVPNDTFTGIRGRHGFRSDRCSAMDR